MLLHIYGRPNYLSSVAFKTQHPVHEQQQKQLSSWLASSFGPRERQGRDPARRAAASLSRTMMNETRMKTLLSESSSACQLGSS
jgi:hypothetical protein